MGLAPSNCTRELKRDISKWIVLVVIAVAGSLCSAGKSKAWEVSVFMGLEHGNHLLLVLRVL